jgi:hypothetical protein
VRRRSRLIGSVAAIALSVTGLSACRSNVGAAASFDGHRITEADVAKYLTVNAEQIPQQDPNTGATTTIPARSWVLRTLLDTRLYGEVLHASPGGDPGPGDLAAAQTALLQGISPDQVGDQYVQHGYKRSFAAVYLHLQALEQILGKRIQDGLDAQKLVRQLDPHVSVNPRYGSWDRNQLQLNSDPAATLPHFLTLGGSNSYSPPPAPGAAGATGATAH